MKRGTYLAILTSSKMKNIHITSKKSSKWNCFIVNNNNLKLMILFFVTF